MLIDINTDFIKVSTETQSGKKINKFIDKDTLINLLADQQGMSTPLLPLGVRRFSITEEGCTLMYETPIVYRNFTFVNRDQKEMFNDKIWWPRMIFILEFAKVPEGWKFITNTRVAAMNNPLVSIDQELYYPPFGNIYPDHRICWGSTFSLNADILNIPDLSLATRFIEMYFNSKFNTDLGIRFNKIPQIGRQSRAEDVYRYLNENDTFNNDLLQKSSKTIKSIGGNQ